MKRIISVLLSVMLLVTIVPVAAETKTDADTRLINQGVLEIDDDGSDGYSGDYVVIYNPSTSAYSDVSTGNMSGLIETEIGTSLIGGMDAVKSDRPYRIDIDSELADKNEKAPEFASEKSISFEVGDTHIFSINSSYCPLPSTSVEFEVLAKGEHCYIWTRLPLRMYTPWTASTRASVSSAPMSSIQSLTLCNPPSATIQTEVRAMAG